MYSSIFLTFLIYKACCVDAILYLTICWPIPRFYRDMAKNENMNRIKNIQPNAQITIYESDDGKARVEVRFENENVWLTQKLIAQLFECSIDNVSLHLKNIFAERELDPNSVVEEYSITASDGKKYKAKHYNLETIIAVGYRVNSNLDILKSSCSASAISAVASACFIRK